jgi:uncharacterized coiled-coil DUF342 family protein
MEDFVEKMANAMNQYHEKMVEKREAGEVTTEAFLTVEHKMSEIAEVLNLTRFYPFHVKQVVE